MCIQNLISKINSYFSNADNNLQLTKKRNKKASMTFKRNLKSKNGKVEWIHSKNEMKLNQKDDQFFF